VDRIEQLVIQISGRRGPDGSRLVASMITGMLTACARQAVARQNDLDQAAALCESFLYAALRGLDPNLIDDVKRIGHEVDHGTSLVWPDPS
jgi:hypothetical protein